MADNEQPTEDQEPEQQEAELKEKISSYEKLLDRLKKERQNVENEISNDYCNARRNVRFHPEEGVLLSFVGVWPGYFNRKINKVAVSDELFNYTQTLNLRLNI